MSDERSCCGGGIRGRVLRKLGACPRCMRLAALAALAGWGAVVVASIAGAGPLGVGLCAAAAGAMTMLLMAHVVGFFLRAARTWRFLQGLNPPVVGMKGAGRRRFLVTTSGALAGVLLGVSTRPSPAFAQEGAPRPADCTGGCPEPERPTGGVDVVGEPVCEQPPDPRPGDPRPHPCRVSRGCACVLVIRKNIDGDVQSISCECLAVKFVGNPKSCHDGKCDQLPIVTVQDTRRGHITVVTCPPSRACRGPSVVEGGERKNLCRCVGFIDDDGVVNCMCVSPDGPDHP